MKEGFIETSGGRIWYSVYGEGKKNIPLLVVHGGPGFMTMPQVVSDLSVDRPVYFYDQLGSGKSDRAVDIDYYSVEHFTDELDEVRRALNLSDVILMGFSWGCGLVTSYVLEKGLKGVKALILSGPLLSTKLWDKDQQENIERMPSNIIDSIRNGERTRDYGDDYQAAMMAYYRRYFCRLDPWPDYVEEALKDLNMDVYMSMWGPSEFTVSGKLRNFELYPYLNKISVPVLLTCGDMDEAGVKTLKDFQMAFPNAQLAVIPNASHLHQIEQPVIYRAIVSEFLSK
jgi:proline iminopeptidase